jgi:hypothetical protein
MDLEEFGGLAGRVLATANIPLHVYFLELVANAKPPPALLPAVKQIVIALQQMLITAGLQEFAIFMELGLDVVTEGAVKMQLTSDDYSVLVLDCLCLTD